MMMMMMMIHDDDDDDDDGMTPQTTPRYARGYIYSLWGSLGCPKTEQKPNILKIFTVVKITTYIFTSVFILFLALFLKKPLHIF